MRNKMNFSSCSSVLILCSVVFYWDFHFTGRASFLSFHSLFILIKTLDVYELCEAFMFTDPWFSAATKSKS